MYNITTSLHIQIWSQTLSLIPDARSVDGCQTMHPDTDHVNTRQNWTPLTCLSGRRGEDVLSWLIEISTKIKNNERERDVGHSLQDPMGKKAMTNYGQARTVGFHMSFFFLMVVMGKMLFGPQYREWTLGNFRSKARRCFRFKWYIHGPSPLLPDMDFAALP